MTYSGCIVSHLIRGLAVHHRAALEAFAAKVYALSLALEDTLPDTIIERVALDLHSDGIIDNSADGTMIGGIDPAMLNQNAMKLSIPNTTYHVEDIVTLMAEERVLIMTDRGPTSQTDSIDFENASVPSINTSVNSGTEPTVTPEPVVTPDPVVTQASLPVILQGEVPEQAAVTIDVNKPTNAANEMVTMTAYDADLPDEGELVINGNTPVALFGKEGVSGNDQSSASVTINTPASYCNDGQNTLVFKHTRSMGEWH